MTVVQRPTPAVIFAPAPPPPSAPSAPPPPLVPPLTPAPDPPAHAPIPPPPLLRTASDVSSRKAKTKPPFQNVWLLFSPVAPRYRVLVAAVKHGPPAKKVSITYKNSEVVQLKTIKKSGIRFLVFSLPLFISVTLTLFLFRSLSLFLCY